MTTSADLTDVLALTLDGMEEVEAQTALSRLVLARSAQGFPLAFFLRDAVEESLKRMREKDLEDMVVHLAKSRQWLYPISTLGLEVAVRNHLFRMGVAWQVEFLAPRQYLVRVSWKGTEGFRLEEDVFPAPWWGLLNLARRVR